MKYLIALSIFFTTLLNAEVYKSVFDCSSGDPQYIASRMALIEKTMNMLESDGNTVMFALTLHGGCVPMVSKNYQEITSDEDIKYVEHAQKTILKLAKRKNVEIVACSMSLEANAIEEEDVFKSVKVSKNSFIDTIKYQNLGYALMPFK